VPIRTTLAPLGPEIERRVATTFANTAHERRLDIRYEVARDPIRLEMIGAGLHSSTRVKYAVEACRGRFPCLSCGFGEPRREAEIRLHTKLQWDASWRLRSVTRPLPVHYARRCEVTWLDIDVTRRFIAPVVESQLREAARVIDANTPGLTDIRPQAAQIWTALQSPIELAPRTWLVLEPRGAALSPITGSGSVVTSTLSLTARTRVVVGEKPAVTLTPLPPLRSSPAATGGVRVPFDVEVSYADASAVLSRELAGKTYRVNGKPLTVESMRLAPAGNGRVLVEAMIDYRGGVLRNHRGPVILEGTPSFDAATSSVTFPDLEYSLSARGRGLLSRIAERAAHESIRDRLRQSSRFSIGPRLTGLRNDVTRALTRDLAKGVRLTGRADAIIPQSVTPLAGVIVIHVVATGAAEVKIEGNFER
jgi:hypothetical protein